MTETRRPAPAQRRGRRESVCGSSIERLVVALALCVSVACGGRGSPSIQVLDLVGDFQRAEKRPSATAFQVAEHTLASVRHATIDGSTPSRIIYTTRFPAHGVLRTDVAVLPASQSGGGAVRFRIGISDRRLYEPLAERIVTVADTARAGWTHLAVDLSRYGGWQWSLFYRPGRHAWQLILNADQIEGQTRALWGAPAVETDQRSARAWRRGAGDS